MKLVILLTFLLSLSACVGSKVVKVEKGVRADLGVSEGLTITFDDTLLSKTTTKTITFVQSGKFDIFNLTASEFADDSPFQYAGGVGYPGEGGNCSDKLSDGESCTVVVAFSPETESDWSAIIKFSYNNGIEPTSKSVTFKGYGGNVAKLESDSSSYEFGLVEPDGLLKQTVTITNNGGLAATNVSYNLLGSEYFEIVKNSCGSTIARGKSCQIIFEYRPEAIATHQAEFTISYDNPETEKQLPIEMTAYCVSIEADLRILGSTTYEYDSAPVGKKLTREFTLSNAGYLDGYDIDFATQGAYALESTNCPARLAPKTTCKFTLSFTPSIIGDNDQAYSIAYQSGKSLRSATINLKGRGVAPANIVFTTPSPYNFGIKGIGDSVELTLMVANTGAYDATDVVITLPQNPFIVAANSCQGTMSAGGTCMIRLQYTPSQVGVFQDAITIDYFNGGETRQTIFDINAEGKNIGVLQFDKTTYSFGTIVVNAISEKVITLKNNGLGAISALAPAQALANPFRFKGGLYPGTGGSCDDTLDPAETCTLILEAESAITLTRIDNIRLTLNNGDFTEEKTSSLTVAINTPATFSLPALSDFQGVNVGVLDRDGFMLTNSGDRTGKILSISLANNQEFQITDGATAPCAPGIAVASNDYCIFNVEVIAPDYQTYTDTLTIQYDDGNGQTVTITSLLSATGTDLGRLAIQVCSDNITFPNTAKDGSFTYNCKLKNIGLGTVSALVFPPSDLNFTVSNIDCPVTLNSGVECNFDVSFTPPAYGSFKYKESFSYNDGEKTKYTGLQLNGSGVTAADLRVTIASPYDFGLVQINTNQDKLYVMYNAGGVTATNVVFGNPAAPFSIVNNGCLTSLIAGDSCLFYVRFRPTDIAVEHSSNFDITFDNGVLTGLTRAVSFKGTGEPPISNHRGWEEIYSIGSNVDIYNTDLGGKMVRLKWTAMTPSTADQITSYTAYRKKSTDLAYDFTSPIAINIATSSRTLTDTSAQPGVIYNYLIKPVILGYPGRTLENYSEVRVVVPPNNMALGHRWMINKQVCESATMSPNKSANYSCTYAGFGAAGGTFDIGSDIIMDRFELGENYANNPGQYPLTELSQPQAWDACEDQDLVNITGIIGGIKKRIPSRKEFTLMGSWSSGLSDAQIKTKERALISTSDCNGNSTEVELTGNNTGCVSKYGVMDIVGNIYEWASDRILNGEGLDQDDLKLDVNNTDLDGIDFSTIATGKVDTNTYFSLVLGMPLTTSAASYEQVANITAVKLHDNYIFAPGATSMKIPLVGGSYSSSSYPGLYSTAWVPTTYLGGARCMFRVGY